VSAPQFSSPVPKGKSASLRAQKKKPVNSALTRKKKGSASQRIDLGKREGSGSCVKEEGGKKKSQPLCGKKAALGEERDASSCAKRGL